MYVYIICSRAGDLAAVFLFQTPEGLSETLDN